MFEFKPEPVPISSSNAELHGTGICARSCKGSISNDFWCPVFVPSGKETFRGWSLGSFPERRVVVEPWPYTSFLHATGISKLESVVCGGRLEEVVNFELSCLIRNDVRCMLFVTCLFSCSFGILKLGIFFRKCRLSHLSHRFYYIETGMT